MLGATYSSLFRDGSASAKFVNQSYLTELSSDNDVERYMSSQLFDDPIQKPVPVVEDDFNIEEGMALTDRVFWVDKCIGAFVLISTSICIFYSSIPKIVAFFILSFSSLWLFCNAFAIMLNGGKLFSELAVLAHATRWGLPIIILMMIAKVPNISKPQIVLLKIFISATFLTHGWEVFCLNPPFQDLVFNSFSNFGLSLSSSVIHIPLRIIGIMDICLAALVLFSDDKKVILWMAFWGMLTALSRTIANGFEAWPDTAMRAANFAAPFLLFLMIKERSSLQLNKGNEK